jgi:hypothetical protein
MFVPSWRLVIFVGDVSIFLMCWPKTVIKWLALFHILVGADVNLGLGTGYHEWNFFLISSVPPGRIALNCICYVNKGVSIIFSQWCIPWHNIRFYFLHNSSIHKMVKIQTFLHESSRMLSAHTLVHRIDGLGRKQLQNTPPPTFCR